MNSTYRNPKLILYNGTYLFIRMLLVLVIGFYSTRLALQFLGDKDFGINNIVAGITAMFAIFSIPIVTSQQRFFNVELSKNRFSENVIFSTSVRISFYLAIFLLLLFETIGVYAINYIITIPSDRIIPVNIIFQMTAITNIISLLYIPFQAFLFSKEKMNICAIVELFMSISKLLFLFVVPFISIDHLISYTGIYLIIAIVSFIIYRIYFKIHFKSIRYQIKGNKTLFREMINFSGWNMIESVSGIVITYGSNIIINIFGGVLYNTAYGISKQLSDGVNNFTVNILKATEPQITNSHITNDWAYRDRLVRLAVKSSLVITGFITIVYFNEGLNFLTLWLVDVPNYVLDFSIIYICSSVFTSINLPLRSLIIANGTIKLYFSIYGILSITILLLAYILLNCHFPIELMMYLILLHSCLFFLLSLYILRKTIRFNVSLLLKDVLLASIVLVLVFCIYTWLKKIVVIKIVGILTSFFISMVVILILTYFVLLESTEKMFIKKILKKIRM